MLDGVKLNLDPVIRYCGVVGDVSKCKWSSNCTHYIRRGVNKTLLPAILGIVGAAALVLRQKPGHDSVVVASDRMRRLCEQGAAFLGCSRG